ncbi:hypothetical protein CFP56_030901 [Quercus suber]|uniref:DUF2921 domain-containing protein n=1 Tax=Quercus suber TaxID=58331 RepID=A0AAW0JN53_QUESU
MENDYNYFELIVIVGLSQSPNYQYQLVDNISCFSGERGGRDKNNININLSLGKLDNGVSFIFSGRTSVYELEYWSDCGSVNCNPFGGYLPNWIAFRGLRCDQHSRKVQMSMGFPNPSTGMEIEFPGPNATLIAEGAWDEKDNQFCGVACRIFANASIEDCSIGLSLRFSAVLSLRNWRSTVGEIWSKKDVNDSEYFGRIGFQSWERPFDPYNLRYEYTEIEELRILVH